MLRDDGILPIKRLRFNRIVGALEMVCILFQYFWAAWERVNKSWCRDACKTAETLVTRPNACGFWKVWFMEIRRYSGAVKAAAQGEQKECLRRRAEANLGRSCGGCYEEKKCYSVVFITPIEGPVSLIVFYCIFPLVFERIVEFYPNSEDLGI